MVRLVHAIGPERFTVVSSGTSFAGRGCDPAETEPGAEP